MERSHGVPYYCEELLKSLYLRGMIVIEAMEEEEECEDMRILFPEDHSKSSQVWQDKEVQEDDILSGSSTTRFCSCNFIASFVVE